MKRYIIILFASLMAASAMAQDYETEDNAITPQQERLCYQKALELMHEYAQSATVSEEDEEFTFRRLFASEEVLIANDLMSLSREDKLYLDEYITTLQKAKRVKVVVKDIRKQGKIENTESAWILPIAFEKGISYSRCGTLFNSADYFGEYYHLVAELAIDKNTGTCKIKSIYTDDAHQTLVFPEQFTVLERTHEDENKRNYKRDDKLTINGRDVSGMWNLYGQVMLHPNDIIKYNNASIEEDEIANDACGGRKIHANYSDKSFRIRPNLGFSLSGFNKLDGNSNGLESKDSEMSFGLDFGYVLPSTSKFYVGFFAGVGISMNDLTLTKAAKSDTIFCPAGSNADEDGDEYSRHYKFFGKGIEQKFSSTEIAIPVYADFEYQFIPMMSVYANLGVRLQTTSDKWKATIGKYETFGTYLGYEGLTIDGSVNLNGFGVHGKDSGDNKDEMYPIDINKEGMESRFSISAILGAGLRANIGKSFAIDAGVQYLMGGKVWKFTGNNKEIFSYSYKLPEGDTDTQKDYKETYKDTLGDRVNLLREVDGIKRSALRITIGLIYKF